MMPPRRRYVSVMIHHDGAPESHSYHVPIWAFRTFVTLAVLLMVGVMAEPKVGPWGIMAGGLILFIGVFNWAFEPAG